MLHSIIIVITLHLVVLRR